MPAQRLQADKPGNRWWEQAVEHLQVAVGVGLKHLESHKNHVNHLCQEGEWVETRLVLFLKVEHIRKLRGPTFTFCSLLMASL